MISSFLSQKFRFWAFISMVLLVFVHGYNLEQRYLEPSTLMGEPLTFTTFFEYFTANGLFRFRIPMLFVISGYLFALGDTKPHKERVQFRLRTLLVPYILWSIIGLVLTFVLEQIPQTQDAIRAANLSQPIREYAFGDYIGRIIFSPIPFQLWFIRVLLVYNLAYPLLLRLVTTAPKIWFGILGAIWLILPIHLGFIEPEGLLFFTLGIWLQKNNINLETRPKFFHPALWGSSWILLCAAKTLTAFYAPPDALSQPQYFLGIIAVHRVCEALGIVTAWFGMDALVRWCMNQAWFRWSSAFSFMIYALHVPLVNYLLHPAFQIWSSFPLYRLQLYFLLPLSIIAFCISVGAVLRKFTPKVYGILTGGRGFA
ncbi:MAG: acyltransferase [Candidatus Kapabacteria bacterium]|jgi:fucose 4-O-acetylase-like acetyltransferase|nr:acyltransferase [Candidatus Kapabacteria bacterium]